MSSDDDYLSPKFLVNTSTANESKTYSHLRKEARKKSQIKHEHSKLKSRKQREQESREEGLSKSLFERAKEDEDAGISSGNKALSIMMKMGFKPGQALGASTSEIPALQRRSHDEGSPTKPDEDDAEKASMTTQGDASPSHNTGRTAPLPINEWSGKRGIGLEKRAHSPSASDRLAKIAKMADDANHRDFRERTRDEYQNRLADGRLGPAQLTCCTLDEQMGKKFNVLWLNPNNENTFPPGLMDTLALHGNVVLASQHQGNSTVTSAERLRLQMRADALQPIDNDGSKVVKPLVATIDQFTPETLEEVTQFLRLQAQDRLHLVLSYLRDKHYYCFWCGIKYKDREDLEIQCPGPNEDDHD